mmetsp:Transcript_21477/g.46659  ORF Transcript_21477/g.46659 Transcript_21477/m.46659 type:complete len:272 (+) Transcript_21477:100-915(+)|eukprot:CAMPEP_0172314342 /NCGR_PEP_ID=MMETSP1058-20130122/22272_1 /TAXON_ID=83371 /ORGANISM="Detonula confervacea, Strain CCMP 353" /LENGTH=271 /DNA_ID=CAMNT_0013028177 /DNA_START=38 /DNA_END=853 /DNA_ORIENTATION=+
MAEEASRLRQEAIKIKAIASAAGPTEDPLANWTRPPRDECPICLITLPLSEEWFHYQPCCGKDICVGCVYSTYAHGRGGSKQALYMSLLSIRQPPRQRKDLEQYMKLAEAGRPRAMVHIGTCYMAGKEGLKQDKGEAIKWLRRAAEAGNETATQHLAICYWNGDGVNKDLALALEYCEKAADLGNHLAYILAASIFMEMGDVGKSNINMRKAVMCGVYRRHIFESLRNGYKCGIINKNEYAFTLRECERAINEMKSEAREKYEKIMKENPR